LKVNSKLSRLDTDFAGMGF